MAEFLFEIGFEEMPASWLAGLADQLKAKFEALADGEQLEPTAARALWTSRRLVLTADVKARQADRSVVEWGPAAKIARDAAGNWSKAAEGFAKKQAVSMESLRLATKAEGSDDLYLSATKQIPGRPTGEVLAGLLPAAIRGLNFPKRMNWDAWLEDGRGGFEFGRPIQWIVALLDGEIVPLTIYDASAGAKGRPRVVAGRRSMGNRFYPRGAADRGFDVRSFSDLQAGLDARSVILDSKKRADRIQSQVTVMGGDAFGEAAALLHEWSDLVEYPTVVAGSIPKEFGDLPDQVLQTVLAHHQKAVTLTRAKDGSPRFAAISGCDAGAAATAARGQERVVVARLKDARFFYDEDRKRPLSDRLEALGSVTFQRGLGSYLNKARRLETHAVRLAMACGLDTATTEAAGRAALLAKADLVTLMVREFPELQGIMGGLYAGSNEGADVAAAIRFQYHPLSVEADAAPSGQIAGTSADVFAVVALADKLDTLVGSFGLGQSPSGSTDPFGLRRAGQGAMRVLLDFWKGKPPDLGVTIAGFHKDYGTALTKTEAETQASLLAFLTERLKAVFSARGFAADEIEAVFSTPRATPLSDVPATHRRLVAVASVRSEKRDVFAALAEAFKRAKNIVGDAEPIPVDENLFEGDAERNLFARIKAAEKTPSSDPAARLRGVAGLRDDVDAFFKGVMVNVEDARIRANRHGILHRLLDLVYEIADLSKLASPAGEGTPS